MFLTFVVVTAEWRPELGMWSSISWINGAMVLVNQQVVS